MKAQTPGARRKFPEATPAGEVDIEIIDPLIAVLDDAVRQRAEDALKRAAWQVNRQEVPA